MKRTITVELEKKSIDDAIRQLKQTRQYIRDANRLFVQALADQGITVAIQNASGGYGKYVNFYKVTKGTKEVATAILRGTQTGSVIARWLVKDENGNEYEKTAEVAPLLMLEFGSGGPADSYEGSLGSQRGTFPGQTHANDSGGWWYKSADDKEWHHSNGVVPRMPMYKAQLEIMQTVEAVARGVFI